MNYAKVFANDQYLVFKPKEEEGLKRMKQPFLEFFENKCFKANQMKKEQRKLMLDTRNDERIKQEKQCNKSVQSRVQVI